MESSKPRKRTKVVELLLAAVPARARRGRLCVEPAGVAGGGGFPFGSSRWPG